MQQIIKKIRNNRHSIWSIAIVSIQAILLGFFISLFFVDSTANFLVFHTVKVLPEAIVASGLAGIILIQLIYASEAIRNQRMRYFLQYGFIFVSLIGLIGLQFLTYTKFFLFFYFAAFIPFSIILTNTLQKVTSNIKSSNNYILSRIIDGLYLIGIMAGGVWAVIYKRDNTIPVEFILATILFVVFSLQYGIKQYLPSIHINTHIKPISTLVSYFSDLPLKGVLLITGSFILLSAISFSLIDYTFLYTLENIFKSTVNLSNFLVLFFIVTTLLAYIFKVFVYQNLIKSFKINKAVIFAPALTILALLGLSLMMLFPRTFDMTTSYSLLFLALVFTRVFVQLIRESFEYYSLKLNLVSQEAVTNRKIEGGILINFNFWAFFFSGMILLILKSAEINGVQLRLLINLLIAGIWLVIAIFLNKTYISSIQKFVGILAKQNKAGNSKQRKYGEEFEGSNLSYLRYILNYQSHYQPHHFRKLIRQLPDTLKVKLGITLNSSSFLEEKNQSPKSTAKQTVNGHPGSFFDTSKASKSYMIESLTESISSEDRVIAVRLITESKNAKYINILKLLIRDPDDEVKR
ncbi:MAG: hypothetical protein HC830_13905, partial [Bacteroidetes bacterium]|nr:hypothetical protein [Bacteroidota bacterium]